MKLLEIKYGQLLKEMESHFVYISKKYFKGENIKKYPRPNFKVRSNLKQAGLYMPQSNMFVVNLDFAADPEQIKAVMYHESIHYYQVAVYGFNEREFKSTGYHNNYFKQKMKEINSGEGKKYVTVTGSYESISTGKSVKKFVVYVVDKANGNFSWSWSPRRNQKLIDQMKRMIELSDKTGWKNAYVFETDTLKVIRHTNNS